MRLLPIAGFALTVAALAACQPSLNWRETAPEGSGAAALFPCKPELVQRPAQDNQGAMGLGQCEAAGQRFALSWADVPDPTQAAAALKAMPQALAAKLGQPLPRALALKVAGMTPMPEAVQHRWKGEAGATRVAVFAHGGRVYQALVTGGKDDAAWEVFLGGLRVGSAAEAAR